MRPAVESDPVSGPIEMGDNGKKNFFKSSLPMLLPCPTCVCVYVCYTGLTQILAHVVSGMRGSINKDINGVELLQSLLSAPWLQSLLKVQILTLPYS